MIHAYIENYLYHSRKNFGTMLDAGVRHFHCTLVNFYGLFLDSTLARRFAAGEPDILVGHSGIELAFEVMSEHEIKPPKGKPIFAEERSPEYWTGWALAYYQWRRNWDFTEINSFAPIEKIHSLYHPYHEMDIMSFVDILDEWYHLAHPDSRLKNIRLESGISQSQLATLSGVPLRTIQQYEQRQKNINAARADALLSLAKALHCTPEKLLEPA